MTVGNRILDFDHQNLLGLLNQVYKSIEQRDFTMFDLVLQELFNYTVGHFTREEEYLRQQGYPNLESHIAIHRGLTQKVQEMRRHIFNTASQQELGGALLDLLSTWFKNHILQEDGKYFRHIQQDHEKAPS